MLAFYIAAILFTAEALTKRDRWIDDALLHFIALIIVGIESIVYLIIFAVMIVGGGIYTIYYYSYKRNHLANKEQPKDTEEVVRDSNEAPRWSEI